MHSMQECTYSQIDADTVKKLVFTVWIWLYLFLKKLEWENVANDWKEQLTSSFNSLFSKLQWISHAVKERKGKKKRCNVLISNLSTLTNYNCSVFNYLSNKHFKCAVRLIKTQKIPLQGGESNYVLKGLNMLEKVQNQISSGSKEELFWRASSNKRASQQKHSQVQYLTQRTNLPAPKISAWWKDAKQ